MSVLHFSIRMHVGASSFQRSASRQKQRAKSQSSLVCHDPRDIFSKFPNEIRYFIRFRLAGQSSIPFQSLQVPLCNHRLNIDGLTHL